MSRWRDQRQVRDGSPRFLLNTNKDPCCSTQHAANTLTRAEAAPIYFHNFANLPSPLPVPQPKNKLYGKTQMNTNIALLQNCDQSATVCWLK